MSLFLLFAPPSLGANTAALSRLLKGLTYTVPPMLECARAEVPLTPLAMAAWGISQLSLQLNAMAPPPATTCKLC